MEANGLWIWSVSQLATATPFNKGFINSEMTGVVLMGKAFNLYIFKVLLLILILVFPSYPMHIKSCILVKTAYQTKFVSF